MTDDQHGGCALDAERVHQLAAGVLAHLNAQWATAEEAQAALHVSMVAIDEAKPTA